VSSAAQIPSPAVLLAWYDRHRRALPWRALPGAAADPYRIWLSEIMLQQTTVVTVALYFVRFVARWPDIRALAAASLDEVLHEWQGLGYYARARNLHACARAVVERHEGRFPDDPAMLRALPGIGDYTAAAIAAIAFDHQSAAVDGNVERVVARLFAVGEPLPQAKPKLRAFATALVPERRAGDFAQAVMDLGAVLCTPRRPRCVLCPWRGDCAAAAAGIAESLPARAEKPERPVRYGVVFWLMRDDGAVMLRRRPEKGLLGGMIELPSTPWREVPWDEAEAIPAAPMATAWRSGASAPSRPRSAARASGATRAPASGCPSRPSASPCSRRARRSARPSIRRARNLPARGRGSQSPPCEPRRPGLSAHR